MLEQVLCIVPRIPPVLPVRKEEGEGDREGEREVGVDESIHRGLELTVDVRQSSEEKMRPLYIIVDIILLTHHSRLDHISWCHLPARMHSSSST